MLDPKEYYNLLSARLTAFDFKGAAALCDDLIRSLFANSDPFPSRDAERILQALRNKRLFSLMQKTADAFMLTGRNSVKIGRLYAQSLIDQGECTAAIAVLTNLINDAKNTAANGHTEEQEIMEVRGLMGRVYKQVYINAASPANPAVQEYLKKAITCYLEVYQADQKLYLWHGINTVALLARGQRDGIELTDFPDVQDLARNILQTIEDLDADSRADMWDFATAAEACVALSQIEDTLKWLDRYVRSPYADAFEIAGTLRQFSEVWQLNAGSGAGKMILPILQAELLKREGGHVNLEIDELQVHKSQEPATTAQYEKVFGIESFETYKWYMDGVDRCQAIARIGRDATQGFGTGFLMRGTDLNANLEADFYLVTNAHVLSNDATVAGALRSDETCVVFEALNKSEEFKIGKILYSSPPEVGLDVTIAAFAPEELERLKEATKNVKPYPIAISLPFIDPSQRVYIIGYPAGGTLCLSLQDNLLLDHQDPLIHYRTPTIGGSSGSPVFNRLWQLIGVHHKGSNNMPKLNGKPGIYEANEGIWIRAVINELSKVLTTERLVVNE